MRKALRRGGTGSCRKSTSLSGRAGGIRRRSAESWNGESWDYAPLAKTCGAERLICFGLCNDQAGYILCDNDYRSMLTENEEINAVSSKVGSQMTEAFEALISDVKNPK